MIRDTSIVILIMVHSSNLNIFCVVNSQKKHITWTMKYNNLITAHETEVTRNFLYIHDCDLCHWYFLFYEIFIIRA